MVCLCVLHMLQFLYLYESTCVTGLANMTKNWQSWSCVWYTTPIEEHFDIIIYTPKGRSTFMTRNFWTIEGTLTTHFLKCQNPLGMPMGGGGPWEFTLTSAWTATNTTQLLSSKVDVISLRKLTDIFILLLYPPHNCFYCKRKALYANKCIIHVH